MSKQEIEVQTVIANILRAFFSGIKTGQKLVPNITLNTFFSQGSIGALNNEVYVKNDTENEYIEFDVEKMEINKFYIVKYHNESYAVRKIGKDQIAFYDVIE